MPSGKDALKRLDFIVLSEDGKHLASGSGAYDDGFCVWDVLSGERLLNASTYLRIREDKLSAKCWTPVLFSPDSNHVACRSCTGSVHVWDVRVQMIQKLAAAPDKIDVYVTCIAFCPGGTRVISGLEDGTICIWDISTGSMATLTYFTAHSASVSTVVISPDGAQAISGSSDRTVCIWKAGNDGTTTDQLIRRIEVLQPIRSLAFSPDGTEILCATDWGGVQVWNVDPTDSPSCRREDGWAGIRLRDDGWLCGPNNELLLWLKQDYRKMVTNPHCSFVVHGGRLHIKRSDAEGVRWRQCYTSIAESGEDVTVNSVIEECT